MLSFECVLEHCWNNMIFFQTKVAEKEVFLELVNARPVLVNSSRERNDE